MRDRFEPIFPYPSRQSLLDLILSMLEQSSGANRPDDLEAYENYFLQESDTTAYRILQEIIEDAINRAELAPGLLRALKEFERMLAEDVIVDLENNPEGRAFLEAMRSIATSNAQAWSNWEQDTDDAH